MGPVTPAVRRLLAAVAVPLVAVVLAACGASGSGTAASSAAAPSGSTASGHTSQPKPVVSPADAGKLAPAQPTTDLRTMTVAMLPKQGIDTLRLIADGGPYPYSKDGSTFSNREGLLPRHPSGWYREFTVVTPGSDDRGARRIIAGQDGSRFYTSDHYSSFREIVSGEMS
ncbi:MAG: ribonuclease domain-containing protein [Candidatus Nanopelagicales bacterium]